MFKKFGDFSVNESKTIVMDFQERRQKALFELAEECAREIIAFMQEKGKELLDYKAYDHEWEMDKKPHRGEIQMLFAGITPEHINTYLVFKYANQGGLGTPLFWMYDTESEKIDETLVDWAENSKHVHFFNSIERDYQQRKGYSWDRLKKDN